MLPYNNKPVCSNSHISSVLGIKRNAVDYKFRPNFYTIIVKPLPKNTN